MASYFQAYFQASSMPKRLLQFALSRLDILDVNDLHLENLDIVFGKNSTFEFRDVGLQQKVAVSSHSRLQAVHATNLSLQKLESLLKLPDSLKLAKSRIVLLRLTIPVDIYSSPILVEVEGVECELRVQPKSERAATSPRSHKAKPSKRRSPSPELSDSAGPHKRRDSNSGYDVEDGEGEDDPEPVIPTAVNLAQSFLETEAKEETAELEAAILSQSGDLAESSVGSDDGELESNVGTGAALSLPGFMARFLQGIVDRLQVKVRGVTFSLNIDIPSDPVQSTSSPGTDSLTVQLKIDDIDIEGVTVRGEEGEQSHGGSRKYPSKEGKRLVYLSRLRGFLISEANVFSALARSSGVPSPSITHSSVFDENKHLTKSHSTTDENEEPTSDDPKSESREEELVTPTGIDTSTSFPSPISSVNSSRHSTHQSLHQSIHQSREQLTGQPSHQSPALDASIVVSDNGRFDDASEDGEYMDRSIRLPKFSDNDMGDSFFNDKLYTDNMTESQFLHNPETGEEDTSTSHLIEDVKLDSVSRSALSTPRASVHIPSLPLIVPASLESATDREGIHDSMPHSSILPVMHHPRFSEERVSRSQPSLRTQPGSADVRDVPRPSIDAKVGQEELDEEEDTAGDDDLAQSQLFSHEDAESMYMSALSHDLSSSVGHESFLDDPHRDIEHSSQLLRMPEDPQIRDEPEPLVFQDEKVESPDTRVRTPTQSIERASSPTVRTPDNPILTRTESGSDTSEKSNATSNYSSRITKHILNLDRVALYVPSISSDPTMNSSYVQPEIASPGYKIRKPSFGSQSVSVNVPGAFSTVLPQQPSPVPPTGTSRPHAIPKKEPANSDSSIELLLGEISVYFDIPVGRILLRVFQLISGLLKHDPPKSEGDKPERENVKPDSGITEMKLDISQISIKFLERLQGTVTSSLSGVVIPDSDVLLQTIMKGLSITRTMTRSSTKTTLALKKFTFGYPQENIISFDPTLQMRASVRDLAASKGVDVCINLLQTSEIMRCEILSLPLHISVDLQRLDETFSWFGGLSSVLNLGGSIVSNATVTPSSPGKQKSRGVRFEAPIQPEDKSAVTQNKIDARIGGFILDIIGTECSIGVETSTVKFVSRDEGVGVSIQKIMLSGPHLRRSNNDPAIIVDITSTRIEYLASPTGGDLDRLLSLITPSKSRYDEDDDILLDTLLRQRKGGAVARLTAEDIKMRVSKLDELSYLPELGEELSRLSTVAKYLPEDDRPGLLSLVLVRNLDANVEINDAIGNIQLRSEDLEVALITMPSLVALSISTISMHRNTSEELLGSATTMESRESSARVPTVMARMIGDEMEPIVKIKLWNLKIEYRVPTLMTLLGLSENASAEDLSAGLTASVATITDLTRSKLLHKPPDTPAKGDHGINPTSKPLTFDVVLRDCVLGLNPLGLPSKILLVLTEAHLAATLPVEKKTSATGELKKASLLVIDNVANITTRDLGKPRRQSFDGGSSQVADLCATGFVSVSYISSAKAIVQIIKNDDGESTIDVELRDDLFVLETCADSTQTLISVLNGLAPPTPPSKEIKYRTKVIPVKDLLASLSGDAFGTAEGTYDFDDDFGIIESSLSDEGASEDQGLGFDSHYYEEDPQEPYHDAVREDTDDKSLSSMQLSVRDTTDGVLLESLVAPQEELEDEPLEFQEDHFGSKSMVEGTAHKWNSVKNTYDRSNDSKVLKSPLTVRIRDVHIIWNLFDGYDWQHTRDTISKAVQDVESKAIERRARLERRPAFDQDIDDDETVIGDFLFNSIYIGIPANRDPRELTAAINQDLNDNATETESVATTTFSSSPSRQGGPRRPKGKRLHLNRSKHHKITFELRGVNVDMVTFPPGTGENQSSIDVRVQDFEIFDHIPTSTWRKFATYMQDAGERETGASMIHIEVLNVKPLPELAASEIVLKATVLPLRLHVDQDALDFITRFFEFKDDSASTAAPTGEVPFLQRVEVNSVQVKLDFKPKRVDYAGLRSGHTTEFMNFLILDEADMVLRHTIIYGISGFDKLGKTLNDIWMPDIKRNQLPGILAGIAPVRSLVNVGGGFKDLVAIPIHEYKKDGRIVRSISKGAAAFAKTTGTELVKLGAKVAIGVQTVLQSAEELLAENEGPSRIGLDDEDSDEEKKQISLYANQPVGVFQGLKGGYSGLQRDLVLARDAIIAVPGEAMEGGTAAGILRAVRKHAPTVILRPAIGVAKASGQVLMGATNSLDPVNLRRAEAPICVELEGI
ncbi:hypothetical protein DH86_00001875 [Scytalidium sp. 3C]|nr:hypothetical protein DH86_00001875 [Scytalidium sp. 3C]